MLCTRVASHAAISETVTAAKQLGYQALSGAVNAICVVFHVASEFQMALAQAHGLPSWLYKRLKKDAAGFEQLDQLTQTLKQTAPLTLRVNTRQISRDDYLEILHEQEIAAEACTVSEAGIVMLQNAHSRLAWFWMKAYFPYRMNMPNCVQRSCQI